MSTPAKVIDLAAVRAQRARAAEPPLRPTWATVAGYAIAACCAIGAAQILIWFARGVAWAASLTPAGF